MRNPSSSPATTASTSKTPCCSKVGIKKGPWTPEEDDLLANYIRREGEGRWRTLPKRAGLLRCGKSCRLRWMNYLRPCVKRGQIAPDEEDLILRLHRLLGNRWALIAGRIPGRTDNEIKNYWNTHLTKKLISQGIDPRTHKPLNLSRNPNSSRIIDSTAPNPNPNPNPSGAVDITSSNPNSNPNPNSSGTVDVTAPTPTPNPKQNPSLNPNSNPNFSRLEQTHGSYPAPLNKGSQNPISPHLYQLQNPGVSNTDEKLQNFDGFMTGSRHENYNSNEEDFSACCNDDTFSSFLNSLINEDLFGNQPNAIAPPVLSQSVTSSTQAFDHGTLWEAAYASTMAALADQQQGLK